MGNRLYAFTPKTGRDLKKDSFHFDACIAFMDKGCSIENGVFKSRGKLNNEWSGIKTKYIQIRGYSFAGKEKPTHFESGSVLTEVQVDEWLAFLRTTSFAGLIHKDCSSENLFFLCYSNWNYILNQVACCLIRDIWEHPYATADMLNWKNKILRLNPNIKPDTLWFLCQIFAKRNACHYFINSTYLEKGIATKVKEILDTMKDIKNKQEQRASEFFSTLISNLNIRELTKLERPWLDQTKKEHYPISNPIISNLETYITFLEEV